MAKAKRRFYSDEEKKKIVEESSQIGIAEASRKLGIHRSALDRWKREFATNGHAKKNGKEPKKKYWSRVKKESNGTIDLKPGHYITKVSKEDGRVVFAFTALPV